MRCICFTCSGQPRPSRASTSSSAYCEMRRYHIGISRFSTVAPVRQPLPSITCSLASTVWSTGSQFTVPVLRVGDALLAHAQEEPLVPAVVVRRAGGDLARPVDGEAQRLELLLHVGDVVPRPLRRRHAVGHGGVLRGQAEGVPAHGLQDVEALHAQEVVERVVDRVVAHVPHVQLARRVGEHAHVVVLGLGGCVGRDEGLRVGPLLLDRGLEGSWAGIGDPLRFSMGRRVVRCANYSSGVSQALDLPWAIAGGNLCAAGPEAMESGALCPGAVIRSSGAEHLGAPSGAPVFLPASALA